MRVGRGWTLFVHCRCTPRHRLCIATCTHSTGSRAACRKEIAQTAFGRPFLLAVVSWKTLRPIRPQIAHMDSSAFRRRGYHQSRLHAIVRAETAPPPATQAVRATLSIAASEGLPRVLLKLACFNAEGRLPPPTLERGWAIHPPVEHHRFTAEQRAFLTELYDKPDRVSEHQAEQLFKGKFNEAEGLYARCFRLTKSQCKAWFSSEKSRRAKAGTCACL